MFTGIVEEQGVVRALEPVTGAGTATTAGTAVTPAAGQARMSRLVIGARVVLTDVELGASIAVNGACLTVVDFGADWWAADVVPETLHRTNLGALRAGSAVNLERPVTADGRLGGHVVLGHVDATVPVAAIRSLGGGAIELDVEVPDDLAPFVVEKGSIALDGVSLTVANVTARCVTLALIPHTLQNTTLGTRQVGERCNLEVDYLAKLVARLATPYAQAVLTTVVQP
jgi:riboflavin synthase